MKKICKNKELISRSGSGNIKSKSNKLKSKTQSSVKSKSKEFSSKTQELNKDDYNKFVYALIASLATIGVITTYNKIHTMINENKFKWIKKLLFRTDTYKFIIKHKNVFRNN
jgi:hypothetical protein